MNSQEFIQYYTNLDKEISHLTEKMNHFNFSNLSTSSIHAHLAKGIIYIDNSINKIYKVIGNHLYKKKLGAILLATKFLELDFFLPIEIIYEGKNLSIISQEIVELRNKQDIQKEICDIQDNTLSNNLIKDNLQYLIKRDYEKDYEKILSLIDFLEVKDIAAHNVGFFLNKIKCYDLEPFKTISINELKKFLIQWNCYNKILIYPDIFYLTWT